MEHCGPCPGDGQQVRAPVEEPVQESRPVVPPAPPPDPAIPVIASGDEAFQRGDWDGAIAFYRKASELRPGDSDVQSRLRNAMDRRQSEINARLDENSAAELAAATRRIEDETHAAPVEAVLEHAQDESAAQRLAAIYDNARRVSETDAAPAVRADGGWAPHYPIFPGTVAANSPPVKILAHYQPRIRNIDKEIEAAQEALRRLIENNARGEDEREAWVKQSEEASADAQNLALSLVIDLLGAHADELAEANKETRAIVFERMMAEFDRSGPSKRIVAGYKNLVATKQDLERLQQEVRLAGKLHDLDIKIRDFSTGRAEPTLEAVWDVASQISIVERLTGPWDHMLNASYTIYRQATSVQRLALIRENDEKTYQASKTLGALIRKLEAEKQAQPARGKP